MIYLWVADCSASFGASIHEDLHWYPVILMDQLYAICAWQIHLKPVHTFLEFEVYLNVSCKRALAVGG